MHFTKQIAAPLAIAGLAFAAPSTSTQENTLVARNNGAKYDDATILNYALT
jgi:hypothetical protein